MQVANVAPRPLCLGFALVCIVALSACGVTSKGAATARRALSSDSGDDGGIAVEGMPDNLGADGGLGQGADGNSVMDPNGITPGPTTDTCAPGEANELGVGAACDFGKHQCTTGDAIFCSADLSRTASGTCTFPCGSDADCGSAASCLTDATNPNVATCVPTRCIPAGAPRSAWPALGACSPSGTAQGVSKPCTAGGNECARSKANFCTADLPGAPTGFGMCTIIGCASDKVCGAGARCIDAATSSLCLATSCLPGIAP